MHLDQEQIQRSLHGELGLPERERIARHLAECGPCRDLLDQARHDEERIRELLRQVDHDMPAVSAAAIAERSRGRSVFREWMRIESPRLRLAAAILLILTAAGVAYTAPGSPLRGWIDRIIGRGAAPVASTVGTDVPSPAAPVVDSDSAGISVPPGERFTIQFVSTQTGGSVTISLSDGPEIVVRALLGDATFRADPDRLTIMSDGDPTDYEIAIPLGAPRVEVVLGGERILLKEGDRVLTYASPDPKGRYVIPLSQAGS